MSIAQSASQIPSITKPEQADLPRSTLWLVGIGLVTLWAGSALVTWWILPTWTERGQFGDLFGAVNSLFSGLALAGIVFTIFLQRQELKLQRIELELTRTELERTATAQEASVHTLSKQVDVMATTARLSALTALVSQYRLKLDNAGSIMEREDILRRQMLYLDQLESELGLLSTPD